MSKYYMYNGAIHSVPEQSDELMHYGVPGMKWGKRKKYYNSDGSLNDKGVKKYAKKQYAREAMRSNKSVAGMAYDAYSGAHKINADMRYGSSTKAQNREAAQNYVKEQNRKAKMKATARAKLKADAALRKIEKQNKKDFIKTRSKEIQKGSSVVGKMWNAYTGSHKIQAEIEYNLRDRKD